MKHKKSFDLLFARKWSQKYAGKFVAVFDEKIVSVGKERMKVFRQAEKDVPQGATIGVFYFPAKKDILTALLQEQAAQA